MSDTPRTDAAEKLCGRMDQTGDDYLIPSDFARKLERENAALREALIAWRILCEIGLQDVVPDWVGATIQPLWELTDSLVPSEKPKEAKP